MIENHSSRQSWKKYQKRLKRKDKIQHLLQRIPVLGIYAGGVFLVIAIIIFSGSWLNAHLRDTTPLISRDLKKQWDKSDLALYMNDYRLPFSPITGRYILSKGNTGFQAETTIDVELQNYIISLLRRSRTYQSAVVALDPGTGKILAMVDFNQHGKGKQGNLCLHADIPAASLFKVISAAAAIEARGFKPDRAMFFNGKRHTLYKSQLKHVKNRYTRQTNFKKAFALSNNPVFGKMGVHDLGDQLMADYAKRFMFNQTIPFDLPVEMSHINIPDDEFGLAEIASGFNKETTLSPLHAALVVSAIANNGTMMEPWFIKNIRDEDGDIIYRARITGLSAPITKLTAKQLRVLMERTAKYGTCRTAFRPLMKKKRFQDIDLGAKTGTINDPRDQYKYDWVMAYAIPKTGNKKICISVLAIHGKKLGIRAKDLARYIIAYRFTS